MGERSLPQPVQRGSSRWPWSQPSTVLPATRSDGSDWPRISVVTPSFNQGRYIEKTLRSVLFQGYPNLEYLVVDGGSTDETVSIVEHYRPWLAHWESEPDRGQSHALNKGFARATGDILTWLNSDDILLPGALQAVAETFASAGDDVGAVVGVGQKVDVSGRVLSTHRAVELTHEAFLRWVGYGHFLQPTCFFTRRAWSAHGPLDESLYYCMDADFWLKVSRDFRFERVEATLAQALSHAAAKTTAEHERFIVEVSLLLLTRYGQYEIAQRNLMEMADGYAAARRKIWRVTRNPLYQAVVPPFYRLLGRLRNSHDKSTNE